MKLRIVFWLVSTLIYSVLILVFNFIPADVPGLHELVFFLFGAGQCVNALLFVPQIYRLLQKKQANELSLTMFLGFNLLQLIGLVFAHTVADGYAVIGYISSLVVSGAVTVLIFCYRYQVKIALASLYYVVILAAIIGVQLFDITGIVHHSIFIVFGIGQFINAALYLPQIYRLVTQKVSKDMSLTTYIGFNLLQCLGILFSREAQDAYAVAGYILSLTLCGTVAMLVLYYRYIYLKEPCYEQPAQG